ncbi:hypothetical protein GPECTOR_11g179 [Gonium pectorale]|uniref:UspA domain-containing protein n=1 Tax=Gonium pectorale TaxID=33097 RepID=A0A150GPR9_GONPE|nr:hypothetical protein GPECTOR_11g179 [Gonium pectorale]|eukprot:KXZ51732.1 hypothetical protein GPECTOR_11g179 [Gonium pectorale]
MSTAALIKSLTQQSEELSRDLDSFSDRAFELQRMAKALKERCGADCVDKATQVETAAVGAPVYQLDRAKRLAPFAFTSCDRKVNWRKLRGLNLDKVVRETDTRALMELYGEVAYADLEGESVYDLTEANMLKLVRVLQLLLQLQQHRLEAGQGVMEVLREETAATAGLLAVLPQLDVGGIGEGLRKLQGDFYKVADADMDAMFAQVRTEERTAARDTVAGQVDQVKQGQRSPAALHSQTRWTSVSSGKTGPLELQAGPRVEAERAAARAAAPPAPVAAPAATTASGSRVAIPSGAAARRIEALRTQPHEFSCSEPSTCGGTILVALDDTEDAAAAVEWVAANIYTPGVDELRVVYVVCDPRSLHVTTSVGTSRTGRPIALDSLDLLGGQLAGGYGSFGYGDELNLQDYIARLNVAAEAVVARRCEKLRQAGLKYELELPRLPAARSAAGIAETLLDAVRRADAKLLVVASHGPGALAEFGSVSRYCYQHSNVPLLLMPSTAAAAAAAAEAARHYAQLPPPPPPAAIPTPQRQLRRDAEEQQREQEDTAAGDWERQEEEEEEEEEEEGALHGAAAAAAAAEADAATHGSAAPQAVTSPEILLVVNHLEELANVWQWVADNCARKGDRVSIWHVAGPSASGMPSLPTAIANQMRGRGLGAVTYHQLYSSTGDPADLGEQVCQRAARSPACKLVVLLNYSRRGLVAEALHGSVASHLSRHCAKPLLLLQLPE